MIAQRDVGVGVNVGEVSGYSKADGDHTDVSGTGLG